MFSDGSLHTVLEQYCKMHIYREPHAFEKALAGLRLGPFCGWVWCVSGRDVCVNGNMLSASPSVNPNYPFSTGVNKDTEHK